MKKLINDPENIIPESLQGLGLAYANLIKVHYEPNFIYRADAPVQNKVALVSGGGSGHEPMHGGFVGMGMLDAACPGAVFTSPTPDPIFEAAQIVNSGAGVLFIIKNYSGDLMNFELAADLARSDGLHVQSVIIDDDVAVRDSLYTQGRRGVGTTIIAEKICGAAAEQGYDLQQLLLLGRKVNLSGRSMGMALTSCTVPAVGRPTFNLGENEIEIGIGIHGEPGRERLPLKTADEITELLALSIIEDPAYTRLTSQWDEKKHETIDIELTSPPFNPGDQVLAFVNSMGGTPDIELAIVYRKLHQVCEKKSLKIVRNLMGRYITSLEMAGCSITLVKMDAEMVHLWDAPVHTPSLRWGV